VKNIAALGYGAGLIFVPGLVVGATAIAAIGAIGAITAVEAASIRRWITDKDPSFDAKFDYCGSYSDDHLDIIEATMALEEEFDIEILDEFVESLPGTTEEKIAALRSHALVLASN
jgi:acyl carrier protein